MRLGGHTFVSARSCTPEWRKRCSLSKKLSTLVGAASPTCSEGMSVNLLFRLIACCWSAALVPGSEMSTFKGVYSPNTAVNPISVIAIRGSPSFTLGAGDKTGGSFPTGGSLERAWTGGSEVCGSGMCRRGVVVDADLIGLVLGGARSGGLGGGRTPLGPDLVSQFPPRQSLIHAFIVVRFLAGISSALTWLSLFLQLEKQYFWRNQRGQQTACLVPFWSFVDVLACEVDPLGLRREHAEFRVRSFVLHHRSVLVLLFLLAPPLLVAVSSFLI